MAAINNTIGLSAKAAGLVSCLHCGALYTLGDVTHCGVCGGHLSSRKSKSLQRTWAFLLMALMAYIPANTYPMMLTRSFSGDTSDTILSGVVSLWHSGSYFVSAVIFIASICIPIAKFIIIAWLALSLQLHWKLSEHRRHQLHSLIELIGRWSMIDVFVVAVLAALIQLGAILSIYPGLGINAFALSVVFSMLSANSLDARLIWDGVSDEQ